MKRSQLKLQDVGDDDPIMIGDLKKIAAASFWPYSADGTYRLVRMGKLHAIVIGRNRYVTLRTLRECLALHVTSRDAPNPRCEGSDGIDEDTIKLAQMIVAESPSRWSPTNELLARALLALYEASRRADA